MDSGIEVDENLKEEYNLMKQNKLPEPIALLVTRLSDDQKKVIKDPDLCLESCTHAQLLDFFGHKDRKETCCVVVFDYEHKLELIKWAPDDAPTKQKMIFASTYAAVKVAFEGIKYAVQASDLDELSEDQLLRKA